MPTFICCLFYSSTPARPPARPPRIVIIILFKHNARGGLPCARDAVSQPLAVLLRIAVPAKKCNILGYPGCPAYLVVLNSGIFVWIFNTIITTTIWRSLCEAMPGPAKHATSSPPVARDQWSMVLALTAVSTPTPELFRGVFRAPLHGFYSCIRRAPSLVGVGRPPLSVSSNINIGFFAPREEAQSRGLRSRRRELTPATCVRCLSAKFVVRQASSFSIDRNECPDDR